jgi:hypothetical protein
LTCWITRVCTKHDVTHRMARIPRLIAKNGDPATTTACPLKHYYEQLLEDLKHVVEVNFEPVKRTILEPIRAGPQVYPRTSFKERSSRQERLADAKVNAGKEKEDLGCWHLHSRSLFPRPCQGDSREK